MSHVLTVSEKITSWGAAGKVYQAGRHPVSDPAVIESAYHAMDTGRGYVTIRELRDGEQVHAQLAGTTAPTGQLGKQDMEAEPAEFACADCPKTFRTAAGLHKHREANHPAGVGTDAVPVEA